jgi:uncharacterized protein YegP (UPF0339 family)
MKFVIKRSRNKQFFFTLVAANGNKIMTSETYERKPLTFVAKLAVKLGVKIIDETKH